MLRPTGAGRCPSVCPSNFQQLPGRITITWPCKQWWCTSSTSGSSSRASRATAQQHNTPKHHAPHPVVLLHDAQAVVRHPLLCSGLGGVRLARNWLQRGSALCRCTASQHSCAHVGGCKRGCCHRAAVVTPAAGGVDTLRFHPSTMCCRHACTMPCFCNPTLRESDAASSSLSRVMQHCTADRSAVSEPAPQGHLSTHRLVGRLHVTVARSVAPAAPPR